MAASTSTPKTSSKRSTQRRPRRSTSSTKAQQGSVASPEDGNTQGYQDHGAVHEQSQWDGYQGQQMSSAADFAFIGSQFDAYHPQPQGDQH
ncbi:hypothetical protein RB595_004971 [Gaeumannomyces hyphopodioides]